MADTETGGDLEPPDAFELVAHELRLAILRALWQADDGPLGFSELRAAVGNPDAGNFNYHLDRLVGPFVTRHEGSDEGEGDEGPAEPGDGDGDGDGTGGQGGDRGVAATTGGHGAPGYELTVAGQTLLAAIESGGYHRSARLGPVPLDGLCPECGQPLEAVYADDLARIRCPDCGVRVLNAPVPAAAVATYEPADLPDLMDRWIRKTNRSVRAHICPLCSGRLEGRLDVTGPTDDHAVARYTCRQCDRAVVLPVGGCLLEHPALVQFAMNHGVDPRGWRFWSTRWQDSITVEGVETDPRRARVRVALGDSTRTFVLDETVSVVDVHTAEA